MKKQALVIAFHVVLGACVLQPTTSRADDYSQSFIDCFDGSPDKRIKGCTAFIKASSNMKQYEAKVYESRGNAYSDKKQYKLALKDYNHVIELDPTNSEVFNSRGVIYQLTRKFASAIEDYDRAILFKPSLAKAYYNRGTVLHLQRKYERAIKDFDIAISLVPTRASYFGNRGNSYEQLGKRKEATADYRMALKLEPAHGVAVRGLKRLKSKEL
jgi:tetratricopeptide (TPR) repeat protein